MSGVGTIVSAVGGDVISSTIKGISDNSLKTKELAFSEKAMIHSSKLAKNDLAVQAVTTVVPALVNYGREHLKHKKEMGLLEVEKANITKDREENKQKHAETMKIIEKLSKDKAQEVIANSLSNLDNLIHEENTKIEKYQDYLIFHSNEITEQARQDIKSAIQEHRKNKETHEQAKNELIDKSINQQNSTNKELMSLVSARRVRSQFTGEQIFENTDIEDAEIL